MADRSAIEWTEATWNPVTGCTQISPGCAHCYAKRFAERFRGVPGHPYERGFDVVLRPERLEQPLKWKRPRTIFVNSMSDLFHEEIADSFVTDVFDVMERASWHKFQVLTKRPERAAILAPSLPWPSNVWLGVSVENQRWTTRIDELRTIDASVRFLSCEPLLGPLDLDLEGIHWVIAGGESGPRARPMRPEWACSVRGPVPRRRRPVLLQAVGRPRRLGRADEQEGRGPPAGRADLGRGAAQKRRSLGSSGVMRSNT